jgi:hypothetical protein
MANAVITVLEADGSTQTDVTVLDVGRQAAAASKSVAASTEDKAVLDAIAASLALLDNSIATGNELQVDVVGALPAGTNAIGKLAANSGVDIGDVDVTSIAAGTNYIGKFRVTDGTNDISLVDAAVASNAFAIPVAIHPDSVNANGQTTMANSAPVTIASNQSALSVTPTAGELHVGEVGGKSALKVVTMSTDTSQYASGDLIADTQQIDGFFRKTDGTGVINTITITEKDAQGAAYYILIHRTSTSMGSENSGPNITDANFVAGIQHIIPVATSDFIAVASSGTGSGTKVATLRSLGLPVMAVSGTDDLYISILNSTGTPTYASGEIQLAIGVLLD